MNLNIYIPKFISYNVNKGGEKTMSRYLINSFIEILIISVPLWVLFRGLYLFRIRRKSSGDNRIHYRREVLLFLFFAYLMMVVSITIFPINTAPREFRMAPGINIIPFKPAFDDFNSMYSRGHWQYFDLFKDMLLRNLGGNFLLFLPLGVGLPLFWQKLKSFKSTLLMCFLSSLSIELTQAILSYAGLIIPRAVDIDDIIMNVLGGVFGYIIYSIILSKLNIFNKASV